MNLKTPPMTAEAFDEFALLPENSELLLEYIAGEVHEVVSSLISSEITAKLILYIGMYLLQNPIAHITSPDGGYKVGNDRYIPDVAVILNSRQPEFPREGYNPIAPDFVAEVVSPSDSKKKVAQKVANYLAAQCMVWVVYPDEQTVEVHISNQPVKTFGIDDTLDGGTLLPDFTLAVKNIFPQKPR